MKALEAQSHTASAQGAGQSLRALRAAVRSALPPLSGEAPEQLQWIRRWDMSQPAPQEVLLEQLAGKSLGSEIYAQRVMRRWTLRGTAQVGTRHVDFYGDCLRDALTGAVYEFQLHTVGLRLDPIPLAQEAA